MKPNPHFLTQLEQQVDKEALVLFICRSGTRSHHAAAAATQAGYSDCYNVLEGFEGEYGRQQTPQYYRRLACGRTTLGTELTSCGNR